MRRHQQPQPSWRPGLDEVNGQKWHRLLQHCCLFIYIPGFVRTLPRIIAKSRKFLHILVLRCPNQPIDHDMNCPCTNLSGFSLQTGWPHLTNPLWTSMSMCQHVSMYFPLQLPNLIQLFLDFESGNEGCTHPNFFFACYCKLLFFVLQHVWAQMPILHVIGVRRVKMVYTFCFTG